MRSRRLPAIAVGVGALLISAPSLGCGASGSAEANAVDTFEFGFRPAAAHVHVGATVSWTNSGKLTHNVQGSGFFSKALDPGMTYRHRFTKPGKYPYVCSLHPQTMRGTVVVSG
ncbi:MAG: hypothetical protein QOJ38_1498 [Solirubrobacterales bacterium]|nr:hypothetical protein [Solirubrobacterales bacterium]